MLSIRRLVDATALVYSFARYTADVSRLNDVFALNSRLIRLADETATRNVVDGFRRQPFGGEALRARHRFAHPDVPALLELPADTLGGAYARFMTERSLSPESIPHLQARTDLEYVIAHFYETHDLWHVLTGFDTSASGEAGLQAFYVAQNESFLPFFLLSAILLKHGFVWPTRQRPTSRCSRMTRLATR